MTPPPRDKDIYEVHLDGRIANWVELSTSGGEIYPYPVCKSWDEAMQVFGPSDYSIHIRPGSLVKALLRVEET